MATKLLVKYRTKKLKSPEEIQDFSFAVGLTKHHLFLYCLSVVTIPVW
jgi:hypothetical protein